LRPCGEAGQEGKGIKVGDAGLGLGW
jgi:hypothetical protein